MFYDERIEAVRGRVCRNATALSLPIAALTLLLRLITLHTHGILATHYHLAAVDATVVIGTTLILLIGSYRGWWQIKDEMWQARQWHYYRKAATVLLGAVSLAYSFSLPGTLLVGTPRNYMGVSFDALFPVLLFVLGSYALAAFRRQDVYFNYSILEGERYARGVLGNVGKGALWLCACMVLSFLRLYAAYILRALPQHTLPRAILTILICYALLGVLLCLPYLLLSYLEWASFTRKQVLSPATRLSLLLGVCFYTIYTLLVSLIDRLPVTQATAVALVNYAASLHEPVRLLLLLFLSYFAYEYRKRFAGREVSVLCGAMMLTSAVRVFCDLMYTSVLGLIWPQLIIQGDYRIHQILSVVNSILSDGENLVYSIGLILLIVLLIRAKRIGRGHIAAIPMMILLWGMDIFLSTQLDVLQVAIYRAIATVVVLLYACAVVFCIRWRGNEESETSAA